MVEECKSTDIRMLRFLVAIPCSGCKSADRLQFWIHTVKQGISIVFSPPLVIKIKTEISSRIRSHDITDRRGVKFGEFIDYFFLGYFWQSISLVTRSHTIVLKTDSNLEYGCSYSLGRTTNATLGAGPSALGWTCATCENIGNCF